MRKAELGPFPWAPASDNIEEEAWMNEDGERGRGSAGGMKRPRASLDAPSSLDLELSGHNPGSPALPLADLLDEMLDQEVEEKSVAKRWSRRALFRRGRQLEVTRRNVLAWFHRT